MVPDVYGTKARLWREMIGGLRLSGKFLPGAISIYRQHVGTGIRTQPWHVAFLW